MASPLDIINGYFDSPSAQAPAPDARPADMARLIDAIRGVESGGNPNALSPQGASGSMQIMPGTFKQYAKPGESYYNDEHRTAAAIRKIEDDWKYFGGDIEKTAAAYIGGRGAIGPDGRIKGDRADAHGTTPIKYVNMVLGRMGTASGDVPASAAPAAPAQDYADLIDGVVGAAREGMGVVRPAAPKNPGALRRMGDAAIDLGKGVVGAGEVVTGLGRLIPGVSQGLDVMGYDPRELKSIMSEGYSDARQKTEAEISAAGERRVAEGQGLAARAGGAAVDLLRNPSALIGRGLESVPSMGLAAGGALVKARQLYAAGVETALASGASAAAAKAAGEAAVAAASGTLKTLGAVGEGLVGAGSIAESIAQDNPNGNVYAAIPGGIATALIGRAATAIPGFGDAKISALTGAGAAGATGGLLARAGKGVASESGQEFLQSGQEQAWVNSGTGRPLMEGVAEAAGQGAAAGGVMGGVFGGMRSSANNEPRGLGNQTGEAIDAAQRDEAALVAARKNQYPIKPDEDGQYNLLLPNQEAREGRVNIQYPDGRVESVAPSQLDQGPAAPSAELTGQQASLDLPPADPYQMDMFGGQPQEPVQQERRAAEPAAYPQPGQLEMPLNQPRELTDQDEISRRLASQVEEGALSRIDQPASVATPEQLRQQDQTAGDLFAASNVPQPAEARPIIAPGQPAATPAAGGIEVPGAPSMQQAQMAARRKAAKGELLSAEEAALLTRHFDDASPAPALEVPESRRQKQVEGQGELFGKPLDVANPTKEDSASSSVQGPQPGQLELIDQRGQPTYAADRRGTDEEVAAQFGKEFTLKVTPQRATILNQVGRLYYDGKIDFDEATSVAEQVRAGKNKAASRSVAALEEQVLNPAPAPVAQVEPSGPAAPARVDTTARNGQAAEVRQAAPAPVAREEAPAAPAPVAEAPAAKLPKKTAPTGTKGKKAKLPAIQRASSEDLARAAEEGDNPNFSADDAELELARRLQDPDGTVNDADYARADKYFNDNFKDKDTRWNYLKALDARNKEAGIANKKLTYRTKEGAGSKYVTREEAQSVVDAVSANWKNAPEIEVVENIGGLPADLRTQAEADGVNPKGVFYDGKVWIVSDNNASTGDVLATVLHEVAGHYGLRALLGSSFAKTMNQIYNGNPDVRKAADAMMAEEGLDKTTAVEEVLADMAETGVKPSVLEKIGNAIRQFLRSIGLGKFADGITTAEVKELMVAAKQAVEEGTNTAEAADAPLYRTQTIDSLADLPEPKPGTYLTKLQDAMGGLGTKSWVLGLMTRRQLVDRFGNVPALAKFSKVVEQMSARAKRLQSEVAVIDKAFEKLTPEETITLSKMMIDATNAKYHVDLEFTDPANRHIDRVFEQEFEEMKARYDEMPQNLKDLYQTVKEKFAADWKATNDLITRKIIEQYREDLADRLPVSIEKAAAISKAEDRIAFKRTLKAVADRRLVSRLWDDMDSHDWEMSQMQGPYFPLMRFGEHVVVAKSEILRDAQEELTNARAALATLNQQDEGTYTADDMKAAKKAVAQAQREVERYKGLDNHYLVEFYESKTEAENRANQIKELFKDDPTMQVERKLREAHFRSLDSAPYGFMKNLEAEIAANLPEKDAAAIKQAVRDMYIRQMPEKAAMKQQLRRLNVRGVKQGEMRRAVISAGLRASFNISRMEFSDPMNDALGELRRGSTDEEKLLGEEMARRMADTLVAGNQSKIINGMSNLSYVTMLGLSPSFLMLNMTQPWTVSVPLLAGRHGFGASGKAMLDATGEVAAAMKQSWKDAGGKMSLKFDLNLDLFKDDTERAMLNDLLERGIIDVTQEHDLSSQAGGDTTGITDRIAAFTAMPAHQTEIVNRVATALAAYRLEKALDLKNNASNATAYAEKIIAESHLDYTAENAPRLMQGKMFGGLGKLIFQFKKYQQGMLYLNFKLLKDAIKEGKINGESAKQWYYLVAAQFGIAGAAGVPFAGVVSGIAGVVAGMTGDEDKDYRLAIYDGLKDSLGEAPARLIMKGAPAALLGIDVSNRAGMGDIASPLKFAREGKTGQETVGNSLLALAGPAASLSANWLETMNKLHQGDAVGAVRTSLPAFMKGPLDAYMQAEQGLTTNRGAQYVKPEEVSSWDLFLKAATFSSVEQSDLRERRFAFDNAVHKRDQARHNLLNEYGRVTLRGGDMGDLMERIAEFNEKNPDKGVRITQGTLLKSRQAQRQYERDLRNGVRVQKQNRRLADEMGITK